VLRLGVEPDRPGGSGELEAVAKRLPHRRGLEAARLFDRLLPEVHEAPGGLHRVVGDPIVAELPLEAGHPVPVRRRGEALEVAGDAVVALQLGRREAAQLFLRDTRRHHRRLLGIDARLGERLEQAGVRVAVDRVQDAVGLEFLEHPGHEAEIAVAERPVELPHHLEIAAGEVLAGDVVGRPRIDVVGTHEQDPPP